MIILTIYGIIPIIGGESFHKHGIVNNVSSNYYYLQRVYQSILPIYAFYYFTLKKQLSLKNLNILFAFLLICSILIYYQRYQFSSTKFNKEEVTNNIGYYFVPLILMLYIVQIKKIWKYLILVVLFAYIMMSIKRGAIFVGTIACISFMLYQLKRSTKKQIAYILSLSIIGIYAASMFVINLYDTSNYFRIRLNRTLRGDSSGRDYMFQNYFSYFTEKSTPIEFLLGYGASGTVKTFGQWAHNDWLEFAIDHGILGIILYLVYWCIFVYEWKNYRGPKEYKRALRDCIIVYFLVGMFSMSFNGMPIAAGLCIGFCLASNVIYLSYHQYAP
jgi:hypothetical protein